MKHLKRHVNRTEVPLVFLVLYAIMVKERSFERSKPAGGQDWHFKVPFSSYISLNQSSAFLSSRYQLLSLFI